MDAQQNAEKAYSQLLAMLDQHGWRYDKQPDKLAINCSATGDDLPMDVRMKIDAKNQRAVFYSSMPFTVPPEKRDQAAVAVAVANYGMVHGCFDYDYKRGRIVFRMVSTFIDSIVGAEMFEYMLFVSCGTVDKYNDRFLMAIKQDMTPAEIAAFMERK